jgi:hypothetical protein
MECNGSGDLPKYLPSLILVSLFECGAPCKWFYTLTVAFFNLTVFSLWDYDF